MKNRYIPILTIKGGPLFPTPYLAFFGNRTRKLMVEQGWRIKFLGPPRRQTIKNPYGKKEVIVLPPISQ